MAGPPAAMVGSGVQAMSSKKQVGGDHYKSMDVQPWDAMQAWMTDDEFKGFLRGNVIKYVARAGSKGGSVMEDFQKAQHYLEELIAQFDHE